MPLPNLCHRAEDFNCQASSSALPPATFGFQFLADYLSVSLGKFCCAAAAFVIIQNVNVISEFFIISFCFGFSVLVPFFGC